MSKYIVTLLSMSTLVTAGDFGCGEQKDCLTVTTQFDSCTKKYTVCLSWENCVPKSDHDTISHVCSSVSGTGNAACNDPIPWGSVCLGKQDSWPAYTPVCVQGEPGGYVNFGVKDGSSCANSEVIHQYSVLGGYTGYCVADSSTSGTLTERAYFEDCVGGNNQECLWTFPVPPIPSEYPPCTTTTPCATSTVTTTVPVPTTITETTTVPVPTTVTTTVPVPTTITETTTVPVPTTVTTTVPVPTTVTETTTVPVPTTVTTTVPVPTTVTETTTVPVPTTVTETTTVPTTVTTTVPTTVTTTVPVPTNVTTTVTKTNTVTSTCKPTPPPPPPGPLCGRVYCGPNAECLSKCKSGPVCRCKPGYWGPNCANYDRNLYPICKSLGCNYGNCVPNGKSCKCACFNGHWGARCV